MLDLLTREELQALADVERPTAICAWLRRNGIPYLEGAKGWPRVARSTVMSRLDPSPAAPQTREPSLRLVKPTARP